MPAESDLKRMFQPVTEALGFELIAVEIQGVGGGCLVRLYIDSDKGVNVDDCALVSRQVSALLDVEDPIEGEYTLEVSSPGVDRPLVELEHFEKVIGERIKVRTNEYILGRRRFTGKLLGLANENISIDVDGEIYEIPFSSIEKARLDPDLWE
ncbi:ribosome maturation factor RimP [Pseudomonadota bacterium]